MRSHSGGSGASLGVAVKWPAEGGPGSVDAPERGRALAAVPGARAARIVELREAGWRNVEIARELGLTAEWVRRVIERAGGVDHDRWLAARFESHLRRARERLDEILQRFRAGDHPQLIARELGLDHRAVWRMVRELSSEADRSARAWALADRRRPKFSDSELLDGLRRVALALGWAPNDGDYDRVAGELGLASSTTIRQRFEGWQVALEAAGLDPSPRRRWAVRWDQAECWRALESVADQLGDPPRYRRYVQLARGRDDLPSGGIVRSRLGLWSQVAAELTRGRVGGRQGSAPRRQGSVMGRHGSASRRQGSGSGRRAAEIRPRVSLPARPTKAFTDERLLAGVRAVAESVGHMPHCGDYRRLVKELGLASFSTVCIRFGSWSAALEAAGFEPAAQNRTYSKKWDANACWDALERVADELGEFPRYSHYEQLSAGRDDLPSGAMLRQRLGAWSQITAALTERREADKAAQGLEASPA